MYVCVCRCPCKVFVGDTKYVCMRDSSRAWDKNAKWSD